MKVVRRVWCGVLLGLTCVLSTLSLAEANRVYDNIQRAGTPMGSPTSLATQLSANSLYIDSGDDAVRVASSESLNVGPADFAVSFWFVIKPGQTESTWLNLLHKGSNDQQRTFSIWVRPSDNRLSYGLSTSSNAQLSGLSNNALPLGTWTHIVYVKQVNQLKLYLNGRLDSITAISGEVLANSGDLYVGASPWRAGALGFYDQVSIYHRQITALEIESLYKKSFPNFEMEEQVERFGSPQTVTGTVAGKLIAGKALRIDSSNDIGLIANSINFAGYAADFTVSFWVHLDAGANGKWRNLMHKGTNNRQLTFMLMLRPDNNRVYFRLTTTANANEGGESVNEIAVNQWTHISYVKAGNTLKLYLNGVLDQTVTLTADVIANSGSLFIGASPWTPPAFATYDRITVIKRALNAEDVARLAQSQIQAPHIGGQWGKIIPWPHIAVSAANLPDGRVLTWSGSERAIWPAEEKTYSATWNPQTGEFVELLHQGHNMFCAHLAMTEEGKVFVNGGRNGSDSPWTSLFDYRDNQWTQVQNMLTGGRWYPTTVALPSGDLFTAMGASTNVANPEKWSADVGWQVLNNINFVQMRTMHNGALGDNRGWPVLSVAPSGELFHFWTNQESFWMSTQGTGQFRNANAVGGSPSLTPGAAIQYDVGKLLITGNNQGSWAVGGNTQAFTVDLNGPTPAIDVVPPMLFPRMFHNMVVLPTGEVLVIGGAQDGVLFSDNGTIYDNEIWNPVTRQWRRVAATPVPRNYHSISLLLTDGRVISAGSGYCAGFEACYGNSHQNAQIYSPPYLFNSDGSPAVRPVITESPGVTQAGQSITVSASGDIRGFSLIKMSATTHAVNTDTRFTNVPFVSQGGGQYQLTLDANPNVLIPGYWMLFALNQNNVPSIAKVLRIERASTITTPGPNRFVKLVAKTEVNGNPWTSVAELNIFDGQNNPLDRSNWIITADSQNGSHPPTLALDGKPETVWNTEWMVNPVPTTPHQVIVDLRGQYTLRGLTYLPRQDQSYGRINAYDVYLSADGNAWTLAASGNFINSTALQTVAFGAALNALTFTDTMPSAATQMASFSLASALPPSLSTVYQWSFGDGSPVTPFSNNAASVTHTYSQPGTYVVVVTARDTISGLERTFTAQQIIYAADIDINNPQRWQSSSPIAFHPSRPQLWSVNPDNNSVSVVDTASLTRLAEIPVGQQPSTLAFANNGDVWVTNKVSGTISVIDAQLFSVSGTINLPNFASRPHGMVIKNGAAFVVLESTRQLLKISTDTGSVLQQVSLLTNPRQVAMSRDGNQLYVSNFITPPVSGESTATPNTNPGVVGVQVLQSANLSPVSTINVRYSADMPTENTGPGLANYLGAMAINPAGGHGYIPAKQDNILGGSLRAGTALTFDQTVRAVSLRINLSTNSESVTERIDHDNASVGSAAVFGPYGIHLFTALEGNRQVAISNTLTGGEISRFNVGLAPQGLALSPNGLVLAVHNFMDRNVQLFDISRVVKNGVTEVNLLATVPTVINEQLTSEVLLGKQIFYDAADDRLAALDYMSCASCHNDGGHDGRVWDFTQFGEGLRNTQTLRGKGGMAHGLLHWTGNFDEVQDFEGQIRNFAGGSGLMNDVDFFAGNRSLPLGLPKLGLSADLDALAAYISSLNTTDDSPLSTGGLSPLAAQGQVLFESYQCSSCHSSATYTDSLLGMRHDVGTLNAASGQRASQALDGLDTPTLLGLWATAPYLHNGSASTVSAAIAAHNLPGPPFTTQNLEALTAYLLELSD
jgi:YVTN family beta-propeller protein